MSLILQNRRHTHTSFGIYLS